MGIAVKAFIVHNKKILIVRRRDDDVHQPSTWDFPGGRLEDGEDPFDGLKREVREEVGITIEVSHPLAVHYFTRDDSQQITMISFLCSASSDRVALSEEHTGYKWADAGEAKHLLHRAFVREVDVYEKHFM